MENNYIRKRKNIVIKKDFFPDSIEIDMKKVFPMLVVATMSSGKSTLINALIGKEFLPSNNMACTTKMYSILDDDRETETRVYITDKMGKTSVKQTNIEFELQKANNDENVSQVFIRGHVKGVLNTDKALLIVDTPGPNNAEDKTHEKKMYEILDRVKGGLILYVMNATQLEISDDKKLLESISKHMEKNKKQKILFVINKCDSIDIERESIEDLVLAEKEYLERIGFRTPNIIPVSALAALLFKKVLSGEKLTRKEYRDFCLYYDLFKPKDYSIKSSALLEDFQDPYSEIELKNETYKVSTLLRAIDNTGIDLLEKCIQREQILSSGKIKNTIKVR